MRQIGAKGEGKFERIGWDEALDAIAAAFDTAAKTLGAGSVWPYHSGGTLGIVQRFGMERLSRLLGYSGMQGHHLRHAWGVGLASRCRRATRRGPG